MENPWNFFSDPMDSGRTRTVTVSDTDDDMAPMALPTSESSWIMTSVPNTSPTHGMYALTGAPIPMIGFVTLTEQA